MKVISLFIAFIAMLGSAYSAQAEESYTIGPQDRLRISVYEWRTATGEPYEWKALSGEFIVDSRGHVSLPLIGSVQSAGQQPEEVADTIAKRLQETVGLLQPPTASVQITQFRPFYIIGSVDKPGEYAYRPGLTVLQAISIAGGMRRTPDPLLSRLERDAINSRGDMRVTHILLDSLIAKRARLQAELSGAESIAFPSELTQRKDDPATLRLMKEEEQVFQTRQDSMERKLKANERLKDLLTKQMDSLRSQVKLKEQQIGSLQKELNNVRGLVEKGFGTTPRQLSLERALAEYESNQLDLERSITGAQVEIAQAERNIIDLRSRLPDEATVELRQTQARIEELTEKLETSRRLVQEAEITAPANIALAERRYAQAMPVYNIVRRIGGEAKEISATEVTSVQPGDTIRVTVPVPEIGAFSPMLGLTAESPRAQLQEPQVMTPQ